MIYRVTQDARCFSIEVSAGAKGVRSLVVGASPAARWAMGRDSEYVLGYYRRMGAKLKITEQEGNHSNHEIQTKQK